MPTKLHSYPLSPLDHLALRVHVPRILYFATPRQRPGEISTIFRKALTKTLESLPTAAGILDIDREVTKKGALAVQGPYLSADEILQTKDLRSEYDYADLQARHFPPDGVQWDLVVPKPPASPTPVLTAQVSLIRGGVILFVGVHHCVMDEIGVVNLLRVWSTYCRGEDGTALVKEEWWDNGSLQIGAGSGRPEDHPQYKIAPEGQGDAALHDAVSLFVPNPTVQTAILFFSNDSLARLKDLVLESIGTVERNAGSPRKWVSTNDALCAFLWTSISSARMSVDPRPASDALSTLRMTMNFRSRLDPPISDSYCGNLVMTAFATTKMWSISNNFADCPDPSTPPISANSQQKARMTATLPSPSHLSTAALTIRASYDAITSKTARDVIQMVNNIPDLDRCKPQGGYESNHAHLALTSWAKQPYYDMGWGAVLGHKCRRLRGRNVKTDGCMAILPHIPNGEGLGPGGLEVLLPLGRSHLLWLKGNEAFNQYAEWRCVAGEPLESSPSTVPHGVVRTFRSLMQSFGEGYEWVREWLQVMFQGGRYAKGRAYQK